MSNNLYTDEEIRKFLEADLPIANYFVYEGNKIGGSVIHCIGPNGKTGIMCIHESNLLSACVQYLKRMNMPVLRTLDEVDSYIANWSKSTHNTS